MLTRHIGLLLVWVFCLLSVASAQESPAELLPGGFRIEHPRPGVKVILDDNNAWAGSGDMGTTHQNGPEYWIEKTLDVPAAALVGVKEARLRVLMAVQDYSQGGDATKPSNGLDETFDLVVNGESETFPTNGGFPGRASLSEPLKWDWYDFLLPVEKIKPGLNTFLFRKSAGVKGDDYLYIAIDNSIERGHSRKSQDTGKTWSQTSLNAVGARGEYMMRLILLDSPAQSSAEWTPQQVQDPAHLFGYAALENGDTAASRKLRLELDTSQIDRRTLINVTIAFQGAPPVVESPGFALPAPQTSDGRLSYALPASSRQPEMLELGLKEAGSQINSVRIDYGRDPYPVKASGPSTDLAPHIAAPSGKALVRRPAARLVADGFIVENSLLQARFQTKPTFRFVALRHELLQKNILAHPELAQVFQIEVDGKRYSAADWKVQKTHLLPSGIQVDLRLPEHKLAAQLTIRAEQANLRWGLRITNIGSTALTWKTAFPCLSGLQLSAQESDDYYLFPYTGGVIGRLPSYLRTGYGEQSAWWQMIDLFSPTGGAGLSVRIDDANGLYKAPVLRKGSFVANGASMTSIGNGMAPELLWKDSLAPAPGTSVDFEYLARTRAATQAFAPPDAVIEAHRGDWHTAMRSYVDWTHRVWKWHRFSPKFDDVWNIAAIGWGSNKVLAGGAKSEPALFRDGKYRTDYLNPNVDVQELYAWWEWSDKAPWGLPTKPDDQLREKYGDTFWDFIKGYIGTDGATEQIQYSQNMGDYKYHTSWGGLPAFRTYLNELRKRGTSPMLYTCPILIDANSDNGQRYGEKYGLMNPILTPGSPAAKVTPKGYIGSFGSWNMCMDNDWYPGFVAQQMARIARDTGTDGIRMDVFGYPGAACSNPNHKHLYAEPGHNESLRGMGHTAELARAAIEKAAPGTNLTTEFPGYDYLFHNLDGSLVYETSWNTINFPVLRPLPVNLLRFYFPEHKTFDLDDLDPKRRVPGSMEYRFWNGMAAFGVIYTPRYHQLLKDNGDVFNAPDAQPLVPTLVSRVYANQFTANGKTIVTLVNARSFTVDEPLYEMTARPDEHVFDLLNGREILFVKSSNGHPAISLRLRPREAACVARLPRCIMSIQNNGQGWKIKLAGTKTTARHLALCAADGTILTTQNVTSNNAQLMRNDEAARAIYVKLFDGKYLIDAAELPTVDTSEKP